MYIFISHSSVNAQTAQAICNKIESSGHKCFLAPRDIRLGHEYASEIIQGIDRADAVLLLLSNEAIKSPHVLREIERAVSKSITVIVYRLEDVELSKSMEYFLMTHQWINTPSGDYSEVISCINSLEEDVPSPVAVADNNSTSKPKRRKFILPIVIALSAILIAAAIITATFILKDDRDNPTESTNSEENSSSESSSSDSENQSPSDTEDTTTPTTDNNTTVDSKVKIGDSIILGKYNNADIKWRVLRISDDGKTAVLISQNILTIKAYDSAESGKGGYYEGKDQFSKDSLASTDLEVQKIAWGDSTWENSTIRSWLNSSSEVVSYKGQPPTVMSFTDRFNEYSTEPGFLNGFTEEEQNVLVETTIITNGNAASKTDTIETSDKVFLLSLEELDWFEGTDIPIYVPPTPEALEQNEDLTYEEQIQGVFKTDNYYWWLREPVDEYSAKCYCVSHGAKGNVTDDTYYVSVPSIGVRPAIIVDLTSELIKAE